MSRIALDGGYVDLGTGECLVGGRASRLTATEVLILQCLVDEGGVVTRERLNQVVWRHTSADLGRAVEQAISRLRKKTEPVPQVPTNLVSDPRGYRLQTGQGEARPSHGAADELAKQLELGPGLISIVGAAGSGKSTRAAAAVSEHRGPVWTWESASGPLLAGLGCQLGAASTPGAVGRSMAKAGHGLLWVDGVAELCAPDIATLTRLLDLAPDMRVVLSVRTPLSIGCERVVRSAPLHQAAAVQMLRHTWPDCDETRLTELATLLDGLPFALCLAMGQDPVPPLDELLACLRSDGELEAAAPIARHRSFAAAWRPSLDCLPATLVDLLVALSRTRGSFDALQAMDLAGPKAVDGLMELTRRSLLLQDGLIDGRPQFCVPSTLVSALACSKR